MEVEERQIGRGNTGVSNSLSSSRNASAAIAGQRGQQRDATPEATTPSLARARALAPPLLWAAALDAVRAMITHCAPATTPARAPRRGSASTRYTHTHTHPPLSIYSPGLGIGEPAPRQPVSHLAPSGTCTGTAYPRKVRTETTDTLEPLLLCQISEAARVTATAHRAAAAANGPPARRGCRLTILSPARCPEPCRGWTHSTPSMLP